MRIKDPYQLSLFDNSSEESKPKKHIWHIYAVDKFDRPLEADIEAYSWKQACWLFREKYGKYWKCH